MQYPTQQFPNRQIGPEGEQNWPPRSPDLNQLDYHVWGYMKPMAYVRKVNTRDELLRRVLNAARRINNAAVLHKVTCFLATQLRKCIQADRDHFEQSA
jgi:hypothetical protein